MGKRNSAPGDRRRAPPPQAENLSLYKTSCALPARKRRICRGYSETLKTLRYQWVEWWRTQLHWRLDVVMNEDQDRSRLGNGPHNHAALRHMAMNVMQKDGEKGSLRGKIKRAGWNEVYLAQSLPLS